MCSWERVEYRACGHIHKRLVGYCHFARNDPFRQCFGVQTTRRERAADATEQCPHCPTAQPQTQQPGHQMQDGQMMEA
ncbi:Similar to hypothetical protein GLRG_04280 [Glomerella graminicola M1.001]; acc. no. EFQ29136 [Pyronema omphalodes CBS 100304]|uniref:Uncharacterized protein n=1 Tax=Pyronema omphalodes (strain CBS 100304) TaxID=1076935 RepID=U4LHL4_PYROM|nr:Similar to hypothetical protein GLRG_04280 [Glomerella graminicola M1.001]; acc. no. EFQ29136 [Pyronema omphalodes CBS 100304]